MNIKTFFPTVCLFAVGVSGVWAETAPKYVFFFLGDGMSFPQVQMAQAFKAHGEEDSSESLLMKSNRLNMTQLPVTGAATTFCDTRFITDSAAAATAFACGVKTAPGVLGRNAELNVSYKSIAELAKEQGRCVGIVTSVSLPHATPAGFYANVNSRNNYAEIGYQASKSGFDFFGGGWFRDLDSTNNSGGIPVKQALEQAGYTILTDKAEILSLKDRRKVICSVAKSYSSDAMPYAMDRPEENFSLAEITQTAIHCLKTAPDGFFILVEGGKIDWAGHANDAAANIRETLAFDDAIGVAVDFLRKHPAETLIVVTGDHETGGLSLGFSGNHYQTAFKVLDGQTMSFERFNGVLSHYMDQHPWVDAESSNIDVGLKQLIKESFGLAWDGLAPVQQEQLEAAYDRKFGDVKTDERPSGYDLEGSSTMDYLLYGGYNALTVTLTHILNREAGLNWSTFSHTAVPVPVMAAGAQSDRFDGFYDNTDIAKKLARIMGLPELPVEDPEYAGALKY